MIFNRIQLSISFIIILSVNSLAQSDSTNWLITDPYKVNFKIEVPVTLVGFGYFFYQAKRLDEVSSIEPNEVLNYNRNSINSFDGLALDFSESGYERAGKASDNILNATALAPVLLLLDKKIRRNWGDFITLYGEAQLAQSAIYLGTTYSFRKARPLVYNNNLSLIERSGTNITNSFFSGHTSVTSAASFFMAKVYDDYHQLSRGQKVLLYAGASIPPAFVGYYRMKAGKHFTSDVLTGFLVGAASGIFIPEFHKIKPKGLSLIPIYRDNFKGLALSLRL